MMQNRIGLFPKGDKGSHPVLFLQESPTPQTGDFPTGDRDAIARDFAELPDQGRKCRDRTIIGTLPGGLTQDHGRHILSQLLAGAASQPDGVDARTRGATPLLRAAAFPSEDTIQLLLDTGAKIDAKDANGDSPLTWASWHLRPDSVLRKLLHEGFSIHPARRTMDAYLLGTPLASPQK